MMRDLDLSATQAGHGDLAVRAARHGYLQPVELPFPLPTGLYGAMLAIWQLRPTLQRWFPLHKARTEDHLRFLAWCALYGRKEYAILREIRDWDGELNRPAALPPLKGDRWGPSFTVGMLLLGVARHRNALSPVFGSVAERHRLAHWYWRGRRHVHHMPEPPEWQLDLLRERFASPEAFIDGIRRVEEDDGHSAQELIASYRLEDVAVRWHLPASDLPRPAPAALEISVWWRKVAGKLPVYLTKTLKLARNRLTPVPAEPDVYQVMRQLPLMAGELRAATASLPCSQGAGRATLPFGVNLFGYAKGELGIGEDVRMVARALKAADIPFCIINVKPGADVSQHDSSADDWLSEQPKYAINIYCMTGIEQVRYICELGTATFRGRYSIGLWPWELPAWPRSWAHAYDTVDEIWGISRYAAQAYRQAPVPVHAMPLPVNAKPVADLDRAHFGLPEDEYLFVYAFDFNSTLGRKNPEGLVKAFQRAFPRRQRQAVGLVLKVSHLRKNDPRWRRLMTVIRADPRIRLIDRMMRRPEILALYRCSDCYVSLHRAEGFGRTIAESLLLGRQVICTGYSGNMDYCNANRVALVDYNMRPLKRGEYFQAHGQSWAEPSVKHAAELMREIVLNPRPAEHPGFDLGFAATGRIYQERLREIYRQYFRKEDDED